MIILSASNLGKSYGTDIILEDISFHINAGDKVGIVGMNGAGKTTLLNMLTGELACDTGSFFIAKDTTVGYLKQRDIFQSDKTVIEEVSAIFSHLDEMEKEIESLREEIGRIHQEASTNSEEKALDTKLWDRLTALENEFQHKGGYTYKSEITGILTSMGFSEDIYEMETGRLSGGERTRLGLACLLLKKPDILMLDEPTNHLDINTLKWLEQYLKAYAGTIIVISHDRYFLDNIVNKIFDVEDHGLKVYNGNYSQYVEKKKAQLETDIRAYEKQKEEIRKQEDLIRRYKERGTEKLAKRAASREKRLAHVERLDKPKTGTKTVNISFTPRFQSGYDVLMGENVSYSYGGASGEMLFKDVDFDIKKGERICIVGDNGIGKTTLLKVMMGEYAPKTGYIKPGHNVEVGYYDQGQLLLNNAQTVMDEIHNEHRLLTDGQVRSALGRFLFSGDSVFNLVGGLSGGEKARLSLLKLMMNGSNLLILDEPTNHLDIQSKEAFEEALMDYEGTVIAVSHDRYFLNRIPDRILELRADGLREFLGNYDYYVEKKTELESGKAHLISFSEASDNKEGEKNLPDVGDSKETSGQSKALSAKEERELQKKEEAEARRLAREQDSLMERIGELEALIEEGEKEMCLPDNLSDFEKLGRLSQEVEDWKADLDRCYDRWMELAEMKEN